MFSIRVTNLRVCDVSSEGNRKFDLMQSRYQLKDSLRTGTGRQLFDYIADCLSSFWQTIENYCNNGSQQYHLGFTFSYPSV